MNTTTDRTSIHCTVDLADVLDSAEIPWTLNRHGVPTITGPDESMTGRVREDDGTLYVTIFEDGIAVTEARFWGQMAYELAAMVLFEVML